MRLRHVVMIVVFFFLVVAAGAATLQPTPRLVVLLSIDQYRADYLTRFHNRYLPANSTKGVGGFEYLLADGASYRDAHLAHIPTETGPGHATLLTGSAPCLDGIIGSDWYDRDHKEIRYCVADPYVKTIGGNSSPSSPRNLLVSTLGDELKLATGGRAKVVGIAYKDRASILMAGHAADVVLWFDDSTGNWVSSTYYANELPGWVAEINRTHNIDSYQNREWTPIVESPKPSSVVTTQRPAVNRSFSHTLKGEGKDFYRAFTHSGLGNELVFAAARRAVEAENLGQDETSDILAINLASNDWVGHSYGPHSPEIEDTTVRTDRLMAEFFRFLAKRIPGGLDRVVIVVTADHAISNVPEDVRAGRGNAGRSDSKEIFQAAEAALDLAYGAADWVIIPSSSKYDTTPNIYLNHETIQSHSLTLAEVQRRAALAVQRIPGVYCAFTADQILSRQLPAWEWTQLVTNGFHPHLGGDVVFIPAPGWIYTSSDHGSTHGAPWSYDTHVPLILHGSGIRSGRFFRRVSTMDIAPTLAQLLGVTYPNGCMGKPLVEVLGLP